MTSKLFIMPLPEAVNRLPKPIGWLVGSVLRLLLLGGLLISPSFAIGVAVAIGEVTGQRLIGGMCGSACLVVSIWMLTLLLRVWKARKVFATEWAALTFGTVIAGLFGTLHSVSRYTINPQASGQERSPHIGDQHVPNL